MRIRDITHCYQPPEQFTSFVMWMHRRTGSTWTTALLNSHPEITMLGEVFNVLDTPADFQEMCNFFSTPLGEHSPRGFGKTMTRVRGFKFVAPSPHMPYIFVSFACLPHLWECWLLSRRCENSACSYLN
eukprot:4770450-Pleurochrysis_carterae.AAC.1